MSHVTCCMELNCPKCRGAMRTYERSGITVDQCSECRGIFLDRGELERLVDAETSFHGAPAERSARPAYGSPSRGEDRTREDRTREDRTREDRTREDRPREDRPREDRYYRDRDGEYDKKRKKRSFLEELFD